MTRQHVYFSPGMFGFGRLGSYSYFAHVERELTARFAAAGHELVSHVIDELPTASIRRRASRLAHLIASTCGPGDEPIHLLGHSTGGLDARLVASPSTRTIPAADLAWLPRLASVTAMNTPHYGTPIASFFATAKGQHALAALSLLTVVGLTIGARPLAAASFFLGLVRDPDRYLPFKLELLNRSLESVVGLVDDARKPEVRTFLQAIQADQGAMLQLSPEAMDLVAASVEDRPGVRYQCTVSSTPKPRPRRFVETVGHPWRALSLSLFYALHRITAKIHPHYPCAALRDTAPFDGEATEATLARVFTTAPPLTANDGVVPLRSQLWGTLAWAGFGDHLDVLGHYREHRDPDTVPVEQRRRDWLTSGSEFDDEALTTLMDAITAGMLAPA